LGLKGRIATERTTTGKRVNPEKYGMIFCPSCKGSGKSFTASKGVDVCKVCRGFGAIKKDDKKGPLIAESASS